MFSFFTRSEKINLDCFTTDRQVYELTPIVKAAKTIPQWWRNLPNYKINFDFTDPNSNPRTEVNMRSCHGFTEFFKKGAVLEHWCDLKIKTLKEGYKFFYSSGISPKEHERSEYGSGFINYQHMKLISPWIFKEKTGVKFLYVASEWNQDEYEFKIPPGILDFNITCATNVNIFLPKRESEIEIKLGQPLVHFIPLSEKSLNINNHLVDEIEFNKLILNSDISFYGWRNIHKRKKFLENREKDGCPFK